MLDNDPMVITNLSGEKIIYPHQKLAPRKWSYRLKTVTFTAAKGLAVTLFCTFIPVLHFVLVPIGILLTITFSALAWKRSYDLENFEVHCPSCDQKNTTRIVGTDLPLRTFCPSCRNMIYINN